MNYHFCDFPSKMTIEAWKWKFLEYKPKLYYTSIILYNLYNTSISTSGLKNCLNISSDDADPLPGQFYAMAHGACVAGLPTGSNSYPDMIQWSKKSVYSSGNFDFNLYLWWSVIGPLVTVTFKVRHETESFQLPVRKRRLRRKHLSRKIL